MEKAFVFHQMFPIAKPPSQLYIGWATLAFIVGLGVDQQVVSDKLYTIVGSDLLAIVPIVIWTLWFRHKGDYRIVTIPYYIL